MKERSFEFVTCEEVSVIAHELEKWLKYERNMEVSVYHLDNNRYALQARCRRGEAVRMFGMDRAVCLYLEPMKNSRVRAVIGGSRWKDKAVAASVSLVTLWPLAITSVVGTAWQILLNAQLRRRLMTYSR